MVASDYMSALMWKVEDHTVHLSERLRVLDAEYWDRKEAEQFKSCSLCNSLCTSISLFCCHYPLLRVYWRSQEITTPSVKRLVYHYHLLFQKLRKGLTWSTNILYSLKSPWTSRHSWYSLRMSTTISVYILCNLCKGTLASCSIKSIISNLDCGSVTDWIFERLKNREHVDLQGGTPWVALIGKNLTSLPHGSSKLPVQ